MTTYIIRRVLGFIPVLFGVMLIYICDDPFHSRRTV